MGGFLGALKKVLSSKSKDPVSLGLIAIISTLSTRQKAKIMDDFANVARCLAIASSVEPYDSRIERAGNFVNDIMEAASED